MDNYLPLSFFHACLSIISPLLFLISATPPGVASENRLPPDTSPVAIFDVYQDEELVAENIPVWDPLSFFPRANDFVSDKARANVNIRLEPRQAVRASFDTGLKSISYESLPNPYYGKFTWNKPSNWSRHGRSELPISVKVHSPVADAIKWIDVYVNGKEQIFRERFGRSFETSIDLSDGSVKTGDQVKVHLKLLDRWGNTITTPIRTVYVES